MGNAVNGLKFKEIHFLRKKVIEDGILLNIQINL